MEASYQFSCISGSLGDRPITYTTCCAYFNTSHHMHERLHAPVQVLMSQQEMSMIESYLQPHMNFLEWGSGRSTLWYSKFVKKYYSIEHYEPW